MADINGIDRKLKQDSLYKAEFNEMIESRSLFSAITTLIKGTAKNIVSPFVAISDAKSHGLAGKTAVGTEAITLDELVLDRKTDNAVTYIADDLVDDKVGVLNSLRGAILRSIQEKINRNWATDILAGSTTVAGTVALGTKEQVNSFLNSVKANYTKVIGVMPRVEHGVVTQAQRTGKPFIVAGTTAYLALQDGVTLLVAQSSTKGVDGSSFETANGVMVINAHDAFADNKQMIYGVSGAPSHGYRGDKLKIKEGEITALGTAGVIDGDLAAADVTIDDTHFMKGEVWEKAGVFTQMTAKVAKQKMA